jgi:DNA repair exonuclease SbcCD ATPase subunit
LEFNKIDVGFDKLEKVLHIADIHIRNYQRHKEYRKVFRQLYKEVDRLPENSIVYVGGDIVHSKTDISPELIKLTTEFLKNLADRRHTIVITGNHDANLNNSSRLDSLSPMIESLAHPKLHYLKDSAVHEIAGTHFVVFSIFDDPKTFIRAKSFDAETKVALFHGALDMSYTDAGYKVESDDLKISMFDGYDMVMLGDIHKRQFYNKEETILQVGSLIQQNFGEAFNNHGCAIWNVDTRNASFVNFENQHGFYTIDVNNGVLPNIDNIPKYPRVRLKTTNTTQAQLKDIIKTIKSKCKTTDIVIIKNDKLNAQNKTTRSITRDIRDVQYQNELLEEYIGTNHPADDETIRRIKNINTELNKNISNIEVSRGVRWKPKVFEFSNMFSYGENNIVDFSKLRDVIGIFAPNHAGKSAILDAVMFNVFHKCSRTKSASDVINNKKKTFYSKLNFEIDGVDYFIERRGKKEKSGHVRVDVDFWMVGEDDEIISLNGEQRIQTDKNIRGYLGMYNDFVLTSMSVQNNNTGFIDMTQVEKKDLLSQFLDITVFEELYQLANEEIKEVQILLRNFGKTDYSQQLIDEEDKFLEYEAIYKELNNNKTKTQKKYSKKEEQIHNKVKELNNITVENDIDTLESRKDRHIREIEFNSQKLEKYKNYKKANKVKMSDTVSKMSKINIDELNVKKSVLDSEKENNSRLIREIEVKKVSVRNKLDLISKLDTHEYDPDCKYCCNNEFVKSADKAKIELEEDKVIVKKLLHDKGISDNILLEKIEVEKLINTYNTLSAEKLQISQYNSEIIIKSEQRKSDLRASKTELRGVEKDIEKYYKNKETIKANEKINKIIENLEIEKSSIKLELDELSSKIQKAYSNVSITQQNIFNIKNTISDAHELELKLKSYEYYLDAIRRDGIPYEIIAETLPYLEEEINNTLSQIVDFEIEFDVDGKNILTYIKYGNDDKWPLELTSGMEKFISSLAIRVALIKISNLPRPNLLAIDEGFGNLDSSNINSISMLFDYLKTEFDFVVIISHIDIMKDMVDGLIEINQNKGYSSVIV